MFNIYCKAQSFYNKANTKPYMCQNSKNFISFLEIAITRIVKNNLFQTISVHESSLLKLLSNLLKSTAEGSNIKKNFVTCNFSSKLTHWYFSWILTTVFSAYFLQSKSFSEHFSVDVSFLLIVFPFKAFKIKFLIYICKWKSLIKKRLIYFIEYVTAEHTL